MFAIAAHTLSSIEKLNIKHHFAVQLPPNFV